MAQFQVTLEIPDGKVAEVRDYSCIELGYQQNISDGNGGTIPNPETKAAFLNRMAKEHLTTWLKNMYKAAKQREAAQSANTSVDIQ